MFKLAIEICFKNHFVLIHAIFLSLGWTKSVHFLGTPGRRTPSGIILPGIDVGGSPDRSTSLLSNLFKPYLH